MLVSEDHITGRGSPNFEGLIYLGLKLQPMPWLCHGYPMAMSWDIVLTFPIATCTCGCFHQQIFTQICPGKFNLDFMAQIAALVN